MRGAHSIQLVALYLHHSDDHSLKLVWLALFHYSWNSHKWPLFSRQIRPFSLGFNAQISLCFLASKPIALIEERWKEDETHVLGKDWHRLNFMRNCS